MSPPTKASRKQPSQHGTHLNWRSSTGAVHRSAQAPNVNNHPAFRNSESWPTRCVESPRKEASPAVARRGSKLANAAQRTLHIPGFRRRARPNLSIIIPEEPRARRVYLARSSLDASARYSPIASSPFVTLTIEPDKPTQSTGSTDYEIVREPVLHCHQSDQDTRTRKQGSPHRQSSSDWQRFGSEGRHSLSHRPTRPDGRATPHHGRKPSWPSQKSRQASLNKPLPPAPDEEPETHEELVEGPSRRVTVVHAPASDAGSQPEIDDDLGSASSLLEARAHLERAIESALGVQSGRLSLEHDGPNGSRTDYGSESRLSSQYEEMEGNERLDCDSNNQAPRALTAATLSRPFSTFEPELCFWDGDGASIAESAYAASDGSSVEPRGSCSTGRTSPDEAPPVPPRSKKRPVVKFSDVEPIDDADAGDEIGLERSGEVAADTAKTDPEDLEEPREAVAQSETVSQEAAPEDGQLEVSDASSQGQAWTVDGRTPASGAAAAGQRSSHEETRLCAATTVSVDHDAINAANIVSEEAGVPSNWTSAQTSDDEEEEEEGEEDQEEEVEDSQPCVAEESSVRPPSLASVQDSVDRQASEKDEAEHSQLGVVAESSARPTSLASALEKMRLAAPPQPRSWSSFGCYAEEEAVVIASIDRARDVDSFV